LPGLRVRPSGSWSIGNDNIKKKNNVMMQWISPDNTPKGLLNFY